MATTVKTKTVNLGRLPVYCGAWGDRVSYHKYNIVTYYGSSFINLVEGNTKYPVQLSFDASNRLESYKFEDSSGGLTGWMFVANSYDASIYATKMGDYAKYEGDRAKNMVDENFFTLDVEDDGDIVVTYSRNGDGNIKDASINQNGDIMLEYEYSTYREVIFNMKTNVGLYPAAGFVVEVTCKDYDSSTINAELINDHEYGFWVPCKPNDELHVRCEDIGDVTINCDLVTYKKEASGEYVSVVFSGGEATFIIPDTPSTTCYIRISDILTIKPESTLNILDHKNKKRYTVLYYDKDKKYIECKYYDVTNLPQTGILEFRTPDNVLHTQEYNSFIVQ